MEAISRRPSSLFITLPALALGMVLLITALVYKQRDLSILTLLLLCAATGAKLWTAFGRRGTQCATDADTKRVFPGNPIELTLTLTSTTFLPLWVRADIPLNGLCLTSRNSETRLTGESGLWRDTGRFRWDVSAPRRGLFRPGPVGLTCGDLFGFFPKESEVDDPLEIIVYPRLVPLKAFSIIRRDFFGIPGDMSPVRDPVYILGTHDYQHGRPARFIHWKASARRHVLQEKVFEPTEQEKVLFVVAVEDFALSGAADAFERSLEAVASMAALFDRQGVATGLVTDSAVEGKHTSFRSVRRDAGHLGSLLEILARVRMEKGRGLAEGLRAMSALPFGVTCLCFSHRMDDSTRAVEEYLRRRRVPVIHYTWVPPSVADRGIRPSERGSVRSTRDLFAHKGKGEQ
ncbi:MAG TPA: DUF58 domain-containing protein [Syntrophorhabdaceae bacterium]|nr:DUF58 domain-containing protein [Syntrophorhabdaceae bacterium]